MKDFRVSPASLAVGVLLTVGVFFAMGQAGPYTPGTSWGPPKKSIVNLFDDQVLPVPGSGERVVYDVPADRWFTVTGVSVSPGNSALRWAEKYQGLAYQKGFAELDPAHSISATPAGGGGEIGWTFRPGSQVVIRNFSAAPIGVGHISVVGYESRD